MPTEEVVEMRRGRKIKSERTIFSGLCAGQDGNDRPGLPSDQEHPQGHRFSRIGQQADPDHRSRSQPASCNQVQEGIERPKPSITFEVGEQVRVADGPFASFNGLVEEVDEERVAAQGCGFDLRPATPVELEYGRSKRSDRREDRVTVGPRSGAPDH